MSCPMQRKRDLAAATAGCAVIYPSVVGRRKESALSTTSMPSMMLPPHPQCCLQFNQLMLHEDTNIKIATSPSWNTTQQQQELNTYLDTIQQQTKTGRHCTQRRDDYEDNNNQLLQPHQVRCSFLKNIPSQQLIANAPKNLSHVSTLYPSRGLSHNIAGGNKPCNMTYDQLARFRTQICPRKSNHDVCYLEERCPFSHCLSWHRRNPVHTGYRPTLCPNVIFCIGPNHKMRVKNHCHRGRVCLFSHTKEEQMYHPLVYKSQLCRDWPGCRKHFCPFAHGAEELRDVRFIDFAVAEGPEKPEASMEVHRACLEQGRWQTKRSDSIISSSSGDPSKSPKRVTASVQDYSALISSSSATTCAESTIDDDDRYGSSNSVNDLCALIMGTTHQNNVGAGDGGLLPLKMGQQKLPFLHQFSIGGGKTNNHNSNSPLSRSTADSIRSTTSFYRPGDRFSGIPTTIDLEEPCPFGVPNIDALLPSHQKNTSQNTKVTPTKNLFPYSEHRSSPQDDISTDQQQTVLEFVLDFFLGSTTSGELSPCQVPTSQEGCRSNSNSTVCYEVEKNRTDAMTAATEFCSELSSYWAETEQLQQQRQNQQNQDGDTFHSKVQYSRHDDTTTTGSVVMNDLLKLKDRQSPSQQPGETPLPVETSCFPARSFPPVVLPSAVVIPEGIPSTTGVGNHIDTTTNRFLDALDAIAEIFQTHTQKSCVSMAEAAG